MSRYKEFGVYLIAFIFALGITSVIFMASQAEHKHFVEHSCVVTSESRDSMMFVAMPDGNGGTNLIPQFYTENLVKCDDGNYWR